MNEVAGTRNVPGYFFAGSTAERSNPITALARSALQASCNEQGKPYSDGGSNCFRAGYGDGAADLTHDARGSAPCEQKRSTRSRFIGPESGLFQRLDGVTHIGIEPRAAGIEMG
jgi:hypothetical protein